MQKWQGMEAFMGETLSWEIFQQTMELITRG
jgi:hypothetical protein